MLFEHVMFELEPIAILQLVNAGESYFQDFPSTRNYFPPCISLQMPARKGGLYGYRFIECLEKR
jgi:hypothetical protein